MIYHWEKVIELICGSTSILLEPNKRIRILKRWCVETSITKMMNFRWHKMHFSKNNYEIHLQENSRFYKASSSRNFTWNFKILPIQNSHWQIYSHRSSNTLPLFLWLFYIYRTYEPCLGKDTPWQIISPLSRAQKIKNSQHQVTSIKTEKYQ